jgi:hypothetical protein
MSLTRFGVAKLRAAVRAMLKQYDGAVFSQWLLNVALQGLAGPNPKTNCDSPRYSADSRYI